MQSTNFARSLCLPALIALAATPALAGKADRARVAIGQAQGKVDAANKLGASGEVPHLQAQAGAALRAAQEDLSRGKKEDAIAEANRASELADTAIGEAQRARTQAARAATDDANARADAAQGQAVDAQQQAAAANARADAAEQSAAAAQADADAARNAPPQQVVLAVPAPQPQPTTTVTTETVKQTAASTPVHHSAPARRVVHHATTAHATTAHATTTEKTTTTVTTSPQ